MIQVNSNGQEIEFATTEEAEAFCIAQTKTHAGSDIWVDSKLHKTYMYNPFTGDFEIS